MKESYSNQKLTEYKESGYRIAARVPSCLGLLQLFRYAWKKISLDIHLAISVSAIYSDILAIFHITPFGGSRLSRSLPSQA